ncbi:MAG: polymorphic toxin type 23 domain-containing protein [Bacteroidota bacterium]
MQAFNSPSQQKSGRHPAFRGCPRPLFFLILVTCLGTILPCQGQETPFAGWVGRGGLTFEFGTHVNRLGLSGNLSYVNDFAQVDGAIALLYHISHLGPRPRQTGWELQASLGALAGFGAPVGQDSLWGQFLSNLTGRTYAVGYGWTGYLDNRKTSQWTATLAVHMGNWTLASENDAYTGFIDDRFRTGTFLVRYRNGPYRVGWHTILWTGDARSEGIRKIRETDYPSRYGYKDLSEGTYGKFSHGITALEFQYLGPFRQLAQARLGLDAEQVRHLLQNVLIHDASFLPKAWVSTSNPHYPMLTPEGEPYLFQSNQEIRQARPYFHLSLNPSLAY